MIRLPMLTALGFGEGVKLPSAEPPPKPVLSLAPMEPRHIPMVALIERATRLHAWSEMRFKGLPFRERTHANVAILGERRVAAYLIHEIDGGVVKILNLATDPNLERRGIARRMLTDLIDRARESGRTLVVAKVPERMLAAQKLLGKHGFCVDMPGGIVAPEKDSFEEGDVFVFKLRLSGGECWGR